jgi:hypothetical protein
MKLFQYKAADEQRGCKIRPREEAKQVSLAAAFLTIGPENGALRGHFTVQYGSEMDILGWLSQTPEKKIWLGAAVGGQLEMIHCPAFFSRPTFYVMLWNRVSGLLHSRGNFFRRTPPLSDKNLIWHRASSRY